MVVMNPVRGVSADIQHPFSRTGAFAPNRAMIAHLRADTGDRISMQRLNGGFGAVEVPSWTWWAAGGLAAGAVAGYFLFKKKGR